MRCRKTAAKASVAQLAVSCMLICHSHICLYLDFQVKVMTARSSEGKRKTAEVLKPSVNLLSCPRQLSRKIRTPCRLDSARGYRETEGHWGVEKADDEEKRRKEDLHSRKWQRGARIEDRGKERAETREMRKERRDGKLEI